MVPVHEVQGRTVLIKSYKHHLLAAIFNYRSEKAVVKSLDISEKKIIIHLLLIRKSYKHKQLNVYLTVKWNPFFSKHRMFLSDIDENMFN